MKIKTKEKHEVFIDYLCRSAFGCIEERHPLEFRPNPEKCPKQFQLELDGQLFPLDVSFKGMRQDHSLRPGNVYTCLAESLAHKGIQLSFMSLDVVGTLYSPVPVGVHVVLAEGVNANDPTVPPVNVVRLMAGNRAVITTTMADVFFHNGWTSAWHPGPQQTIIVHGTWVECESFFRNGIKFIREPA